MSQPLPEIRPERAEPPGYIPYPGYADPQSQLATPPVAPTPGYYTPSEAQAVVPALSPQQQRLSQQLSRKMTRRQRRMARQAAKISGRQQASAQQYAAASAAMAQYIPDAEAPYGRDPASGEPLSSHSRVTAAFLQLFFGTIGAGRFYIGDQKTGFITMGIMICAILLISLFPNSYIWILFPALGLWSIADFIMMLSGNVHDPDGRKLR